MDYDFEKQIKRFGTNSVKWDLIKHNNYSDSTLPLWVADMDFSTAPEVVSALSELVQSGIWGYSFPSDSYFQSIIDWQKDKNDWQIKRDWLVLAPGVMPAINVAIRAFSNKGDAILIQEPIYHPFRKQIESLDRIAISSDLLEENCRYSIDFSQLEDLIKKNDIKLFIFCSPHNPVGRVWTEKELIKLGNICLRHKVIIVADEIHHDLILPEHKHLVLADLSSDLADITITCTAPTKTFNLAGLPLANIVISNSKFRKQYVSVSDQVAWPSPSPFSLLAGETAFIKGKHWLSELLKHIKNQYDKLVKTIEENDLPLKASPLEGTYLAWLDCRKISTNPKILDKIFLDQAKLWFNNGSIFGKSGEGFMRINLACSSELFEKVLQRLTTAITNL